MVCLSLGLRLMPHYSAITACCFKHVSRLSLFIILKHNNGDHFYSSPSHVFATLAIFAGERREGSKTTRALTKFVRYSNKMESLCSHDPSSSLRRARDLVICPAADSLRGLWLISRPLSLLCHSKGQKREASICH